MSHKVIDHLIINSPFEDFNPLQNAFQKQRRNGVRIFQIDKLYLNGNVPGYIFSPLPIFMRTSSVRTGPLQKTRVTCETLISKPR